MKFKSYRDNMFIVDHPRNLIFPRRYFESCAHLQKTDYSKVYFSGKSIGVATLGTVCAISHRKNGKGEMIYKNYLII